jgi:hypothetical protein
MPVEYILLINGQSFSVDAEPDENLLSVLRDELDLTGRNMVVVKGDAEPALFSSKAVSNVRASRRSVPGDGLPSAFDGTQCQHFPSKDNVQS